jgi:pimeloyl-ACP methyl ester carboxylesterase
LRGAFEHCPEPILDLGITMLRETPPALLQQGGRLIREYRPEEPPPCPIFAIHGGRDRVMAPPAVGDCRILPGAGHGLVMTHPAEVADLVRRAWRDLGGSPIPSPPLQ